jgi:formylglycine-generating enzyme required for sulfatase activity
MDAWILLLAAASAAPALEREGARYVHIPAGALALGCVAADSDCQVDETPPRRVRLSVDFWMAATEVTVRDYRAFARATGRRLPRPPSFDPGWTLDDHPIVNVTWREASDYCEWRGGRLPTEAQWEHAARAGQEGWTYFWGRDVAAAAALRPANAADRTAREKYPRWEEAAADYGDGFAETAPVGRFAPNAWGLHDMAGNALEWCSDWYGRSYYRDADDVDPAGPRAGDERSLRGGSWQDPHRLLRISDRFHYRPHFRASYVGFRCVRPASAHAPHPK